MAMKVESYQSKDGRLHRTERDADLSDIEHAIRTSDKPHLTTSISLILREADFLAEILAPLAPAAKNHPAVRREPPLKVAG